MYVFILLAACCCACALAETAIHFELENANQYFEEFISKFEKQYADEHEKASRFEIFKANLEKINQLNNKSRHAVFGITRFLDLTAEEFTNIYTGLGDFKGVQLCPKIITDKDIPNANAPESFDWRQKGAVTQVKDQKECGSCYSFSVTGNLEGQHFIKNKQLIELSKQQIVDCDKRSAGCFGGLMPSSLVSLAEQGGSMSESDYPYKAQDGKCAFDKNKIRVVVKSCNSYNVTSQEKIKQLLFQNGPIAIGIRGAPVQGYTKGIIHDDVCQGDLNHGVLLVGYGTENNIPFWIVKNSWGSDFGEDGYFRMQRSENVNGACGMLNDAMASGIVA